MFCMKYTTLHFSMYEHLRGIRFGLHFEMRSCCLPYSLLRSRLSGCHNPSVKVHQKITAVCRPQEAMAIKAKLDLLSKCFDLRALEIMNSPSSEAEGRRIPTPGKIQVELNLPRKCRCKTIISNNFFSG